MPGHCRLMQSIFGGVLELDEPGLESLSSWVSATRFPVGVHRLVSRGIAATRRILMAAGPCIRGLN